MYGQYRLSKEDFPTLADALNEVDKLPLPNLARTYVEDSFQIDQEELNKLNGLNNND